MSGPRLVSGIAKGLSAVFNPPFLAACLYTHVILTTSSPGGSPILVWVVSLFFGVILPTGYVIHLVSMKRLTQLFEPDRDARRRPLLFSTASCIVGTALLGILQPAHLIVSLMSTYAILGTILVVVNRFSRVSLHAAGAWLPVAALFCILGKVGLYSIPVALGVSWSRVATGAHTPLQVAVGAVIALCTTWVVLAVAGI